MNLLDMLFILQEPKSSKSNSENLDSAWVTFKSLTISGCGYQTLYACLRATALRLECNSRNAYVNFWELWYELFPEFDDMPDYYYEQALSTLLRDINIKVGSAEHKKLFIKLLDAVCLEA